MFQTLWIYLLIESLQKPSEAGCIFILIFIDEESTRLWLINWPRSHCPVNGQSGIWTRQCGPRICVFWKAFSLEMTSKLCLECLYLVWQNHDWVLSPWFSRQRRSGVKVKRAQGWVRVWQTPCTTCEEGGWQEMRLEMQDWIMKGRMPAKEFGFCHLIFKVIAKIPLFPLYLFDLCFAFILFLLWNISHNQRGA